MCNLHLYLAVKLAVKWAEEMVVKMAALLVGVWVARTVDCLALPSDDSWVASMVVCSVDSWVAAMVSSRAEEMAVKMAALLVGVWVEWTVDCLVLPSVDSLVASMVACLVDSWGYFPLGVTSILLGGCYYYTTRKSPRYPSYRVELRFLL